MTIDASRVMAKLVTDDDLPPKAFSSYSIDALYGPRDLDQVDGTVHIVNLREFDERGSWHAQGAPMMVEPSSVAQSVGRQVLGSPSSR